MFYEYISSTFLNGFINYVAIKDAWCLNRYSEWSDQHTVCCVDRESERMDRKDFTGTREEMFNLVTQLGRVSDPSFYRDFDDDVLILSKCRDTAGEEIRGMWMFFWFDSDCSDSCIGRFQTGDRDFDVISSFQGWVNSEKHRWENKWVARQIPLHYFKCGWLSS
jgi:hypothetical protein